METLGYHFRRPELLELALTHRSFAYESRPHPEAGTGETSGGEPGHGPNPPGSDNEQLEFLGDAVLGLVMTDLLFRNFPDRSEGELTRMRASLVSRERMATLGAELGLANHLRLGRSAESNNGRRKPTALANTAEAVLAAIFLDAADAGEDALSAVRALLTERLLTPAMPALRRALAGDKGRGALRDFKTLLQERVQAENAGRLLYVDVAEAGPPHQRCFTVQARLQKEEETVMLASAEGASKKEAQQRAAERALSQWEPGSAGPPSGIIAAGENAAPEPAALKTSAALPEPSPA